MNKKSSLALLLAVAAPFVYASPTPMPANQYLKSNPGLCFTENKGQWDNSVLFKAEGAGGLTWFIERDGFTLLYSIPDLTAEPLTGRTSRIDIPVCPPLDEFGAHEPKAYPRNAHALKFRFVRLTPPYSPPTGVWGEGDYPWIHTTETPATAREVIPSDRLSHNNNYFLGNDRSRWAPNCGNYTQVTMKDVWEGIDVEWWSANFPPYAAGGEQGGVGFVEFDFIVHPGANPAQIRMECLGLTDDLTLTSDGEELLLPTSLGVLKQVLPEAYQVDESGRTVPVPARFVVKSEGVFGVEMPEGYSSGEKLVIDPLVYSTYLGGGNEDYACALAPDGEGGMVVAGVTYSDDFPTIGGAFDVSFNGGERDAFIARLSEDGSELLCSTYLGGGSDEYAYVLTPDGDGGVIVVGVTYSNDFPTTEGAFDRSYNDNGDAFVARLSGDGSELLYSTYLGGGDYEEASALAPDGAGGVVVAGYTGSDGFPTTDGAFDRSYNDNGDAFVARLSGDGTELLYSTYLGGGNDDYPLALAADGAGGVVAAGHTESNDFLTTEGAFDRSFNGNYDAFVTRLSGDLSELLYSTYLGGGSNDYAYALVPDGAGGMVVVGFTDSNDFPTTAGAFDGSFNGGWDAFAARLSADGSELLYSTYLGGGSDDIASALVPDGAGGVIVAGNTGSDDFPTTEGAFDRSLDGGSKAFITRLREDGSELLYSTYLGGGDNDVARALAPDGAGGIVVAGSTRSDNFPITEGACDRSLNGISDAFVARLNGLAFLTWAEMPDTIVGEENQLVGFNISGESSDDSAALTITYHSDNLPDAVQFVDNGDGSGTFNWQTTYDDAGEYSALFTLSDGENELPDTVTIIVHNVNSPPQPFNLLSPEDGYRVAYDPDSLGTVDFVWEEARQAESDTDAVTYWMVFSEGTTQYTLGTSQSTLSRIAIQALVDSMGLSREREISFGWDVWAMDSETHVFSSNGPWTFTIPALEVSGSEPRIPDHYYLSANYPNPFNARTRLKFGLPVGGDITLEVWDITGRKWASLTSGYHAAGYYEAVWNAGTMPAGVYLVRMETSAGFNAVTKAVLVK